MVGFSLWLLSGMVCMVVCAEGPAVLSMGDLPYSDQVLGSHSEDIALNTNYKDISSVIGANNKFCFDMFRALTRDPQNDGQNIFFSPFSILSALALANEGAQSVTKAEISSVLSLPKDDSVRRNGFYSIIKEINNPDTAITLKTANALWAEETYHFRSDYIALADRYYAAKLNNLDFIKSPQQSAMEINSWIEERTDNKIQNLVRSDQLSDAKLIITNAIYFYGNWAEQFDSNKTSDDTFKTSPDTHIPVRMMHKRDADYKYTETADLQVLELPYKNNSGKKISMLIILPISFNLSSAENILTIPQLSEIRRNLTEREVDVEIPKFTFSKEYQLKPLLSSLGMPTAFSRDADFSGMDGTHNLFISEVIHKSFIEVDEQGTKAAAATSVGMALVMAVKGITFRADHPFIFVIQDADAGTIFFIGRVTNPG